MPGTQANIPYDGKVILYKENGNTGDIIAAIKAGDAMSIDYVRDFAETMRGDDIPDTCANLWYFIKNNIPFIEDHGKQVIQLPGAVYENRYARLGGTGAGADCKSMSLFCSSVLRALGFYDFNYRFISENAGSPVHHVYLIVACEQDGKKVYLPLDCTLKEFAVEVDYAKHTDMAPTHPVDAPRVGEFNFFKIGAFNDGTTTQAQSENSFWEVETTWLKINFWAEVDRIRKACMKDIFDKWKSHPIKYSEMEKSLLKNWEHFLAFASTAIYYYWNDTSMLAYHASRNGEPGAPDIPFPSDYDAKRQTSFDFVDGMHNIMGISLENIRQLVTLGTYRKYGIGLEYMLYRCYCLRLYGQPFAPKPGIPYWNNLTGVFINNGSDLGDDFNIVLCFPAQGGVSRPYGQPYWSTGGNVIDNGFTNDGKKINAGQMDAWLKDNPRPGTPDAVTGVPVPGVIVNNGAGITDEKQLDALKIYNKWAAGNMVMLPAPTDADGKLLVTTSGGQKLVVDSNGNKVKVSGVTILPYIGADPITLGVTAIVSIVVAVVTAVATIATLIAKLVQMFKHPGDASKIALPTSDFKWDYQTGDGCIIGHCAALGGCNGATTVKMCNGKIVAVNPNPNDPSNQHPDPGTFFGGTEGKKKMLLVGAGIITAGAGLLMLSSGNKTSH
jgi:hypothetical protein